MTRTRTFKRMAAICAAAFMMLSASVASINAAPRDGLGVVIDGKDWPDIVANLPAVEIAPAVEPPAVPSLTMPIVIASRDKSTRMFDRKSAPLAGVLYTMMALDTKSTYDVGAWCRTCVEADPFAAPFIKAGPGAAYAAGLAFDTGVMYVAHKMRHSWNPVIRKIWFVLPVSLAAGHAYAMHHNYQLRKD